MKCSENLQIMLSLVKTETPGRMLYLAMPIQLKHIPSSQGKKSQIPIYSGNQQRWDNDWYKYKTKTCFKACNVRVPKLHRVPRLHPLYYKVSEIANIFNSHSKVDFLSFLSFLASYKTIITKTVTKDKSIKTNNKKECH